MDANREPLLTNGTITGIVAAIVALVVAFGVDLSQEQTAAILGVAVVLAPFIVVFSTRPKVTPVADPVAADGTRLVKSSVRAK